MNLPQDDFLLLSFVNTKLRDEFVGLEDFCLAYDVEISWLCARLESIGYRYTPEYNAFTRV